MDFVVFLLLTLLVGVALVWGIIRLRLLLEKVCPACYTWIPRPATKCPRCHTPQQPSSPRRASHNARKHIE